MPTSKLATSVYVAPKVNDHEWTQVRDQDYPAEVNQADAMSSKSRQFHIPGQAHRVGGSLNMRSYQNNMQQYQSMYDLRRDKDLKNYGSEYDNPLNAKLLPSQVSGKSRE